MIQALDLPIRLDKKSRRATGWVFAEDQTLTVERDSNTVQIVNNKRPLQPGELYDTPEGWCIDTDSLAGWLGVTLTPDLRDSVLTLASERNRGLRYLGSTLVLLLFVGIFADWSYTLQRTNFAQKAREFAHAPPGTTTEFALRPPGWNMILTKQAR